MFAPVRRVFGRLLRSPVGLNWSQKEALRWLSVASGTPRVQKLLVNGVNLHYVLAGEGEHAILCIAGALGTARGDFGPQLEFFGKGNDLSAGARSEFTIVGFDAQGYGSSRPPKRDFQIKPVHFLRQDGLDGHELMQRLDFKTYSVLGWSDGAIAAMFLAASFPHAMRKLVVWGGNAFVGDDDILLFEQSRDLDKWSPRKRREMEAVYGSELGPLWSRWIDSMVALLEEGGNLCQEEVGKIQCPTLILHGDKDPLVPQHHPAYLKENIAHSQFHQFPDGKHGIHLQYAAEFNRIVKDFLLG